MQLMQRFVLDYLSLQSMLQRDAWIEQFLRKIKFTCGQNYFFFN